MIDDSGLILGLRPANERRRYKVTSSLIGWVQPRISPELHYPSYTNMAAWLYLGNEFLQDIFARAV